MKTNTIAQIIEDKLYNNQFGSDVTFLLPQSNNETIKAHRLILSIRSPVFKAMFFDSNMLEQSQDQATIREESMSKGALTQFLRYLYTDKIELTGENGMTIYLTLHF